MLNRLLGRIMSPALENLALVVGLFSYDGGLFRGFNGDRGQLPDGPPVAPTHRATIQAFMSSPDRLSLVYRERYTVA